MTSNPWIKVVFAADCSTCDDCGEPICRHGEHYADCFICVGPHQDDLYEYEERDGVLHARLKVH